MKVTETQQITGSSSGIFHPLERTLRSGGVLMKEDCGSAYPEEEVEGINISRLLERNIYES